MFRQYEPIDEWFFGVKNGEYIEYVGTITRVEIQENKYASQGDSPFNATFFDGDVEVIRVSGRPHAISQRLVFHAHDKDRNSITSRDPQLLATYIIAGWLAFRLWRLEVKNWAQVLNEACNPVMPRSEAVEWLRKNGFVRRRGWNIYAKGYPELTNLPKKVQEVYDRYKDAWTTWKNMWESQQKRRQEKQGAEL